MLRLITIGIFLHTCSMMAAGTPPGPWPQGGPVYDNTMNLLIIVGVIGFAVLGCFGYLYWREWSLQRQFRQLRLTAQEGPPFAPSVVVARKTLIRSPRRLETVRAERPAVHAGNGNRGETRFVASGNNGHKTELLALPVPSLTSGTMNIRADDDLHEIFIDSEFVGMTPAKLTLAEGVHDLEIKRAGYSSYRREIKVIAGAEVNLHAVLKSMPTERA